MNLSERMSQLMTADPGHRDPPEAREATLEQLLGEMEVSNLDLRRAAVLAVTQVRRLEARIRSGAQSCAQLPDLSGKLAEARRRQGRLLRDMLRLDRELLWVRCQLEQAASRRQAAGNGPAAARHDSLPREVGRSPEPLAYPRAVLD